MSNKSSIQVGIKMRPLLSKEKHLQPCWQVIGNTISSKQGNSVGDPFCFDFVFDQDTNNQVIFENMAKHIVHSAVHGFNGTIFAYGQTASGKTYTMMGEENDPGVMVLAAKEIFNEIDKMTDFEFLLRGGFIEIYNEKIYDLLSKSDKNKELKIHEGANGNVHVNCEEYCITNVDQLLKLLAMGNESRTVGETNMNERSSRSHAIFLLIIESRQANGSEDDKVTQSVLNLVDLAGSERADQTGARGTRLKEGGHINKSLLFLSNVISRLSENEDNKYISYRDSKLTRILQASLGGNAFTSIICTVTPISLDETLSTLNFATRAKTIKNKPQLNEIVSDSTMMKRLTREIQDLKKKLEIEKRKNASQIQLNQIQDLLGRKEHNFITSFSLKSSRNSNSNRRRTWCAETDIETDVEQEYSTNAFRQNTTVRLQLPKKTPLTTLRHISCENKLETPFKMDIVEEEFVSATNFDFNLPPETPKKNAANAAHSMDFSPSPGAKNTTQHVELLERQLASLEEFANLEKEVGVEHDLYANIKYKLESMYKRNEMLESERIKYLETQNELFILQDQLSSSQNRCDILQNRILQLENDKETADKKVEQYDSELLKLREKIQSLETENCNFKSLEFEFEAYRKKTKLRENELLEVIEEKQRCITGYEQYLKNIGANKLNENKDQLKQLRRCSAASTVNGNNADQLSKFLKEENNICLKCEELNRLLDENKKRALEFDDLTLRYRELQNNFEKITSESKYGIAEFSELQNAKSNECKDLCDEISMLQLKLENFERDYIEVKCDRDEKSVRCESLFQEVEVAKKEIFMLQNKCAILEDSWQKQDKEISIIKLEYDSLEKKYNDLKTTYENLEHTSTRCSADCERLQYENDALQTEIHNLKTRVEEKKTHLLQDYENKTELIVKQKSLDAHSELQWEHNILQNQYKELTTEYDKLRNEFEQLSTNILETLQENDALTSSYNKIDNERKRWESDRIKLEEKVSNLQQCLEKNSTDSGAISSHTSDIENVYGNVDVEVNQSRLQHVEIIELMCGLEKHLIYTANDLNLKDESGATYKLSLEKWQADNYTTQYQPNVVQDSVESGSLKAIITHVQENEKIPIEQRVCTEETIKQLQETILNLKDQICRLQVKNKDLIESSEKNINELREEIISLTRELFEKSLVLDEFIKEKADLTLLNEELQMKIAFSQSDMNITNSSAISTDNQTIGQGSMQSVVAFCDKSYDDTLKTIKSELMHKEEECKQLQLDMLEKIELAENEFRSHLRKYNDEWEQSRLTYEEKINRLETLLAHQGITVTENGEIEKNYERQNFLRDDVSVGLSEYEENYGNFHGDQNSSTPNTATMRNISCERALDVQSARLERSQIVEECNEQISKCCTAIRDVKEVHVQLAEAIAEKEELLQMKDAEIESLKAALEMSDLKPINLSLKENIGNEDNIHEINDDDKENIKMMQLSERRDVEVLELKLKTERQLKDKTEKLLNHLECEHRVIIEERNILLNKVNELMEQNKGLNFKLDKAKEEHTKLEQCLDTALAEKCNLQLQLNESNEEKVRIETYIQVCETKMQELSEKLNINENLKDELDLLKKQEEANAELIKNMRKEVETLNQIVEERDKLKSELTVLRTEYVKAEKDLSNKITDLIKEMNECKKIKEELKEKSDTLTLKMESYEQELYESKQHISRLETTLDEYKDIEKQLDAVIQEKEELELKISNLRLELSQFNDREQLECQKDENYKAQIEKLQEAHNAAIYQEEILNGQISTLKAKLSEEQEKSQQESKELQSQLNELQYKCRDLNDTNTILVAQNKEISKSLEEADSLRKLLKNLEDENQILKACLETSNAEIKKNSASFQMKLREQEKACTDLRATLAAKESAKLILENTLSNLQSENKNLIERLEELSEIIKKRTEVCESANNSMETSANSQKSPLSRRSPCKTMAVASGEDKITSIQKERRNRRLSTHDENRRQSSKFIVYNDASTMTEKFINNCTCQELKEKLSECKTNLYIRESQVKALNMELRHHPLKAENQALVKRIQEEQEKNRLELKKYKVKITEQAAQIQGLIAQTNIAPATSLPMVKLDQATCTSPSPRKNLKSTETQTDLDIDQCLHKLQGKYNDLKNLCRFRHNRIIDLEKKLKEKENIVR